MGSAPAPITINYVRFSIRLKPFEGTNNQEDLPPLPVNYSASFEYYYGLICCTFSIPENILLYL